MRRQRLKSTFFIFHFSIPKESIVDVQAVVKKSPEKIEACSQKDVELHIKQIWTTSQSEPVLPLQIEDAARKGKYKKCA